MDSPTYSDFDDGVASADAAFARTQRFRHDMGVVASVAASMETLMNKLEARNRRWSDASFGASGVDEVRAPGHVVDTIAPILCQVNHRRG